MTFNFKTALEEEPEPQAPAVIPVTFPDAESVKKGLEKYDPEINAILDRAGKLEVKDDESRAMGLAVIADAKNLYRAIEAKRETLKAPALEYGRTVDKMANYYKDRLLKAEAKAKEKDLVYKKELDRQQAAKEAAAREEARKFQAKIDEENRKIREEAERKAKEAEEKLKTEKDAAARALLERTIQEEQAAAEAPPVQVVVPVIEAPPKAFKTGAGTLSYTKKWKCRLVDASKVEDRFKVVDVRLAQKAVDNGERNLPGFEVYEEETSSARV